MRKLSAFIAMVAVSTQMAMPVLASELPDPSAPLGWTHQGTASTMAYFRMPLGGTTADAAQPRFGIMTMAPRPYSAYQISSHLDAPPIVDFGFTGRDLNSKWTATLNFGNQIAWAQDPTALPAGMKPHFLDSGLSWVLVGAATIGLGVGLYAVIER